MALSQLHLGLIGCGRIAQDVHLNILARLPGVRVTALAEPDAQRRAEAQRRAPGAAAYSDYRELLTRADMTAVVVCVPSGQHAAAGAAVMNAGKHLYLEKPLATNLGDGGRLLDAWRRAHRVGMIGFNYRFHRLHQEARRQLRSGRLGRLLGVRSVFAARSGELPTWKETRSTGGGVLLDLTSHHVDLARFLFSQEVREVFCALQSQRTEDDTAMLQLRLADGLPVQSFFSLGAVEEDRWEIYGESGKLTVDRHARSGQGFRHTILSPRREPSYAAALNHFVEAVRGEHPASPDLLDGYRSLAVIEAAEESARRGQPVALEEFGDANSAG